MKKNVKNSFEVPIVNEETILEEVLQEITKTKHLYVLVKNKNKKITGKITITELLEGIKRPSTEKRNYT